MKIVTDEAYSRLDRLKVKVPVKNAHIIRNKRTMDPADLRVLYSTGFFLYSTEIPAMGGNLVFSLLAQSLLFRITAHGR